MTSPHRETDARSIFIVGAGGFGREVLNLIDAVNELTSPGGARWNFIGFVADDRPMIPRNSTTELPWLGTVEQALSTIPVGACFVVAIGDPGTRRRVAERFEAAGFTAATLVHPRASLGSRIQLGPGSIVCANSTLTSDIQVGSHTIININSTVGHDAVIGAFVSVSPLCAISGSVRVDEEAFVGTGAALLPGRTVGKKAAVGAGAVVTHDVAPSETVVGNPARPLRRASER
jgi:sugar O-acyltransferase (sialic acid O-acetyltransferase NeuD family)